MIVIDTSALFAILQEEIEAPSILGRIAEGEKLLIGAPTKFEALIVAAKRPDGQDKVKRLLKNLNAEVADWTDALADIAGDAFIRFGKGRHPAALNFGDCMAYALAKSLDAPLLFKGRDFALTDIRPAL